jgi:hypothetical protein
MCDHLQPQIASVSGDYSTAALSPPVGLFNISFIGQLFIEW